jgi:hypothetical protein
MRNVITTLVLMLLIFPLLAENVITQTIRGRVTDRNTLQPLPGANIIVSGSDPVMGASTDVNGFYELKNVPVGRVDLKISYMGYKPVLISNISHISGKETILNVSMDEFIITGQEVVVSAAAGKSQPINPLTAISARGFTVEETERFAGSRNDVARMASGYAGVVINSDDRNDIVVRGNSPSGLLWRLEGIDIPSPNHWAAFGSSGGPVSMLNNSVLANSDFISGAFPAEYGNATASVFDLRMRTGNDQRHEQMAQVGFNGFELGAEGPLLKDVKGSYLVNMRYSTMEVFDMLGMNFGTTGIPKYNDISFKVNLPQTRYGSFSAFGLGGRSKIAFLNSNRGEDDLDYYSGEGIDLRNGADMGVLGMNHIVSLSPTTYVRSTIALSHRNTRTQVDSIIPVHQDLFRMYGGDMRENRISGAFSVNSRLNNRNTIKSGINISHKQLLLADSVYNYSWQQIVSIRDTRGSAWLMQPYLHWQHHISNELTLNSGLHYQHFLLNNTSSVEPRLGLSYQLIPGHTLSMGAGRHSQLLAEPIYYSEVFDGTSYSNPNKDAGMIKSDHLVLGYDFSLATHTRLKVETYYQKLFNVPVNARQATSYSMLNEGANFGIATPEFISGDGIGQNIGIELTMERFFHKGLYYLLTASVFDSKYRGSDRVWRNTAFNNNFITNALAGYEFKVGRSQKRRNVIDINLKTTLAGGQRYVPFESVWDEQNQLYGRQWINSRAFETRHSDYFRTDLSIGFKMNTGKITQEWMLEITNLFNNENVHSMGFDKKTGENKIVPQLGRMIIPQWRIRF